MMIGDIKTFKHFFEFSERLRINLGGFFLVLEHLEDNGPELHHL